MRRGQSPRPNDTDPLAFTKQQLMDAAQVSPKTFDSLRRAARVRGPGHGGLNWKFSRSDVEAMIHKAEGGTFTERGPAAAEAWRYLLEHGAPPEPVEDEDE